jgi:hypothetical protein
MKNSEYILHSGGAKGADTYFEEIGREFGLTQFNHYWHGKMNPSSKPEDEISEDDFNEGVEMVHKANSILKRRGFEKYMNLLARNWCQVKYSDATYAIGEIKSNKVSGGTGWACSMSILEDKPLYVFDQNKEQWYFWNVDKFEVCVTPKLTKNFAGIGTRKINDSGIVAIRKLYEKTFNI